MCVFVVIWFPGESRIKVWCLDRAQSLRTELWHNLCVNLWIYQLMTKVSLQVQLPTMLWCDNQVAIHIASNLIFHKRTKYIEIDCHCVLEKVKHNLVTTGHVKTSEQMGDIFTKTLDGGRVDYICSKLGMINLRGSVK